MENQLNIEKFKEYLIEHHGKDSISKIGEDIMSGERWSFSGYETNKSYPDSDKPAKIGPYTIEPVFHHGGEGEGESFYGISRVAHQSGAYCHVAVYGWWQSYEGSGCDDLTDWKVVKPKQKTVTVYE